MKIKFSFLVLYTLLSASPNGIVQAMQTQNIQTCVRSLKANALLTLARAIQEKRVDMNLAMQVLPQELRSPLNKLVTVDLTAKELDDEIRKAEGILGSLNAFARNAAYKLICHLLSRPIKTIDNLLLELIQQNDVDTAQIVLETGADPNFEYTFLHEGEDITITPLIAAIYAPEKNNELVQLLLRAGANLNPNIGGPTPLLAAIQKKQPLIVSLLLEAGAQVNPNEIIKGRIPLMVAAEHSTPEIVALLLKHGADRAKTDILGRTTLDYASDPAIRKLLTT